MHRLGIEQTTKGHKARLENVLYFRTKQNNSQKLNRNLCCDLCHKTKNMWEYCKEKKDWPMIWLWGAHRHMTILFLNPYWHSWCTHCWITWQALFYPRIIIARHCNCRRRHRWCTIIVFVRRVNSSPLHNTKFVSKTFDAQSIETNSLFGSKILDYSKFTYS